MTNSLNLRYQTTYPVSPPFDISPDENKNDLHNGIPFRGRSNDSYENLTISAIVIFILFYNTLDQSRYID
jgi:hypothetical protein